MFKRITAVLIVDSIEDQLPFYEKRLGFVQAMAVPHGDALGFVGLVRDDQMVMLQTRTSLADDMAACAEQHATAGGTLLFCEVDSLDEATAQIDDAEIVTPRRETFYGMREVWIRDPAGNVIGLAERIA